MIRKNYISEFNRIKFAERLQMLREQAKLSRYDFGQLLNKSKQQIQRYENKNSDFQFPKLDTFSTICSILNVDPCFLLGIEVDVIDDGYVSYDITDYKIYKNKIVWACSECNKKNIFYLDISQSPYDKSNIFECEHCNRVNGNLLIKEK